VILIPNQYRGARGTRNETSSPRNRLPVGCWRYGGSNNRLILDSSTNQFTSSWVGSTLVFTQRRSASGADIRTVTLHSDGEPDGTLEAQDFLATEFDEVWPELSPDGRFMAYVSNESGEFEVYIRPFPGPGRRVRVSTAGGSAPRWSSDGREIFWVHDRQLMMARVQTTPHLAVSRPASLFETPRLSTPMIRSFDVDPSDGSFLFLRDAHEPDTSRVVIVLNWVKSLEREPL